MINPISTPGTDPIFRTQQSAFNALRKNSTMASEAGQRLNSGERILNPGDDPLAFSTSRKLRAQMSALNTVASAGQQNMAALSIAQDGLSKASGQLESLKGLLVAAQSATSSEKADLQTQIDTAIANIDSTAKNARFGGRSLLDGSSSIRTVASVNQNGSIQELYMNRGNNLSSAGSAIVDVRVNRIGSGMATRNTAIGDVLSLNVVRLSGGGGNPGSIKMSVADAFAASESITIRVTGNRGSTTLTIAGSITGGGGAVSKQRNLIQSFNALANDTGVVMTHLSSGGTAGQESEFVFQSLDPNAEGFVKIEILGSNNVDTNDVVFERLTKTASPTGVDATQASATGSVLIDEGKTGTVLVNGTEVEVGGMNGTTATYRQSGFDIDIDLGMQLAMGASVGSAGVSAQVNIIIGDAQAGILGPSASQTDLVQYGFRDISSSSLGSGGARLAAVTHSDAVYQAAVFSGDSRLGVDSLSDLATGSSLDLSSGKFTDAARVIENSIGQVLGEQARLGTLQGQFTNAINSSQSSISTLATADADITSIDAASEVTNFTQAQLGLNLATSILRGSSIAQQTVLSLLQ